MYPTLHQGSTDISANAAWLDYWARDYDTEIVHYTGD